MSEAQRGSPYQGLIPYDEQDAPFFFGREKETRIITANLFASRLTLLYGASGVGKSSVLQAGVVRQLHERKEVLAVVVNAWRYGSVASSGKSNCSHVCPSVDSHIDLPVTRGPPSQVEAHTIARLLR